MQLTSNRIVVPALAAAVVVLAGVAFSQHRHAVAAAAALATANQQAAEQVAAAKAAAAAESASAKAKPDKGAAPGAPCKLTDRELFDQMTIRYTDGRETWPKNKWLGIPALQNPLDVWITQEILTEVKPDFVVETGTFAGGSAALWATILEQLNDNARVITIDVQDLSEPFRKTPILQKRVDFLIGSSVAPEIVADVKKRVDGKSAVVILDALHTKEHVLNELNAYAPIVPVGSYMIVQDGVFNGHPVPGGWGPGPYEAIEAFLAQSDEFVADRSRERLLVTSNPMGFLRRVKPAPGAPAQAAQANQAEGAK